jgi:tRNA(Ile)-lysidine synthase
MLQETIKETIKKYNLINNGDRIVIGVSGGPDSICLLHILNSLKDTLNFKIYVAHINHMIRQEAEM